MRCSTKDYGMTGEKDVGTAAQQTIHFIAAAQDKQTGGWADRPGATATMTNAAWNIMALRNGASAGLTAPPTAFEKAAKFLDSVQVPGVKFGETGPKDASDAATAMGLLSRVHLVEALGGANFLGGGNMIFRDFTPATSLDPGKWAVTQKQGLDHLSRTGCSTKDAAYNFFATVLIHSNGGQQWDAWNRTMRRQLVAAQTKEGDETGSWWNPADIHAAAGGRLFQTAINAMMLEVYYR